MAKFCAKTTRRLAEEIAQTKPNMATKQLRSGSVCIRAAQPADIPALMRLKRLLAQSEGSLHAVRATAADWLRDGFGPAAGFTAFVAEAGHAGSIIGMATCSQRIITGWSGPVIFLQDLVVQPDYRRLGVATALMGRVAAHARDVGSPMIELTVRAGNPAQNFYRQSGFQHLPQCLTYVLAGHAFAALADRDSKNLALAG